MCLKFEARPEHDAIEAALGLTQRILTHAAYRRTLERLYGFYRPVELERQATLRLLAHRLDLTERLKTPLLYADLRALGIESPEFDAAVAAAKDTFPERHRWTVAQGDSR